MIVSRYLDKFSEKLQFSNSAPLPQQMIICLYYSYRVVLTYTITILTIKTALMAAFILDFNRMSGGKKCH